MSKKKPRFVIQKHDARTLHYDFRLEVDGVLKSWVIPKGPSTDPRDKRLAMPTEDHDMDYADFEGVIAEGSYGAGTVLIWDTGTYRNLLAEVNDHEKAASMSDALRDGKIEVWLEGKKLRGGYALVQMSGSDRWLFVKMDDEEADARRNPISTQPDSAVTGRTIAEIRNEA